jgi:hypothetical protein
MPTGSNQQLDDFDLQSWLADISADGSLSQDEVNNLKSILGKDKVTTRLKDQVLMRRDYSRKTQELADGRRALEADVNSVLQERQNLAEWKSGLDDKYNKIAADLEAARITEGQYRARISTLARQYNADEKALLEGISTPEGGNKGGDGGAPANKGGGNGDQSQYLTREDVNKLAAQRDRQTLRLLAEFPDIAEEHQELFGKSLRTFEYTTPSGEQLRGRSAFIQKALDTNDQLTRQGRPAMDLRRIWETTFDVPKKREEMHTETLRTQIRGELEGEYRQKATEAALNGGNAPGRPGQQREHSPVFAKEMKTPAERDAEAAAGNGNGHGDNGRLPPPAESAAGRESRWQKSASSFLDRRARGIPMGQPDVAKSA